LLLDNISVKQTRRHIYYSYIYVYIHIYVDIVKFDIMNVEVQKQ